MGSAKQRLSKIEVFGRKELAGAGLDRKALVII